jgi:subtilisin
MPQKKDQPERVAAGASNPARGPKEGKPINTRTGRYLIAHKAVAGLLPLAAEALEQSLNAMPGVQVVKTLMSPALGVLAEGAPVPDRVVVATMTPDRAEILKQSAIGAQVIIEPDRQLSYSAPDSLPWPDLPPVGAAITPTGTGIQVTITVMGNNAPVEGAQVTLFGNVFPAQGVTDSKGLVTLTFFGGSLDSAKALYVKPTADFWTLWLSRPALIKGTNNVVTLQPLSQTFHNFPNIPFVGWGERVMSLDLLPDSYRGKGVRVAVIDSGADIKHRNLHNIHTGFDAVAENLVSWSTDTVFHGTHCAGVIAGTYNGGVGIRGFAPDAEVHVCKIFPGGRFSHLISAIDYCIQNNVDVINLSLGSDSVSEIVEQRIRLAKQLGIACIVAAGNSGGPVQYPASSQNVLAVAAIGKLGEFPDNSYHSQTVSGDRSVTIAGSYFSARFTCFGPEIDICAPGVAIVSSIPPNNYAAWDGTSMAAPHVTGLAALILAHHPDFQEQFKARNAQRVERLFQILKQSAQPLNLGDPNRTGAGLPNALKALNVLPQAVAAGAVTSSDELLRRIFELLQRNAVAVGTTPTVASVRQLEASMWQAGLLPEASRPGAGAAEEPQQGAAILQQLKDSLQQAGLLPASSGTVANGGAPANEAPKSLQLLKASMQQCGLS